MDFIVVTVEKLKAHDHTVEATDIPGLWRVDGGPEITTHQLHDLARGMMLPWRGPNIIDNRMIS